MLCDFVILSDSEGSVLSIGMVYTRSWPREGQLLCCDKVTKPLVIRNASLPHVAFALQTGQNHGLLNLASTSFAQRPLLRQGLLMPCQPHNPPCSARFSSEVYLLTGRIKSCVRKLGGFIFTYPK